MHEIGFPAGEYTVFQWRSETRHKHLEECAWHLVRSKLALGLGNDTRATTCASCSWVSDLLRPRQVILISDLMLEKHLQWYGIQREDQRNIARVLDVLREHNFVKVDQVIDPQTIPDLVFFAIWDAVIAAEARTFVTCHSCAENPTCNTCTWKSKYAALIVELRAQHNDSLAFPGNYTTLTCWPSLSQN